MEGTLRPKVWEMLFFGIEPGKQNQSCDDKIFVGYKSTNFCQEIRNLEIASIQFYHSVPIILMPHYPGHVRYA